MDYLQWLNKLELGEGLLRFVDNHYFKYLLFIKLTRGSNINIKDVKDCSCSFSDGELEITMKFKKKIDIPELSSIVEDNIHNFDFGVDHKGSTMKVTIRNTQGAEAYSNANRLDTYA